MLRRPCPEVVPWVGAVAAGTLLAFLAGCGQAPSSSSDSSSPRSPSRSGRDLERLTRELTDLENRERHIRATVWTDEIEAQRHGALFDDLWDELNRSETKLKLLQDFGFGSLVVPRFGPVQTFPFGVQVYEPSESGSPWTFEEWSGLLGRLLQEGWSLEAAEFRHVRFEPRTPAGPARSRFTLRAHCTRGGSSDPHRAALEGELAVEWGSFSSAHPRPAIRRIDATEMTLKLRSGPPLFEQVLNEAMAPPAGSFFIDPLILHDLDGDGSSEIILAAKNLVLKWTGDGSFERSALCRSSPGLIFTGIIADFDGDAEEDFLCARFGGLILYRGSSDSAFEQEGVAVWTAEPRLRYGQVLTCGDIDGDGDLDLWLGQYKTPYQHGQMPTPFFDANDGYPSHLLVNDGSGHFQDQTVERGLGSKRWRRTYSASWVDLDFDTDLDLLVVSDFAGIDVYTNDGQGNFKDMTDEWMPATHAFGMAHLFSDLNADGYSDLLVVGMNSPTVDRLQHYADDRSGYASYRAMGKAMSYGNRLFRRRPVKPFFRESNADAALARTGWSWGPSAPDLDNDGWPDVYLANGHETKASVREYEPEFWLHDIYVGDSTNDPVAAAYFGAKAARTRGRGYSYGGYEKNRLYWNRGSAGFVEVGHLFDVALEVDCRNVISDDLDGDGRMDLLVTSFEAWPQMKQTLGIFLNRLPTTNSWIGVQLSEERGAVSPIGARVTLEYPGGRGAQEAITGDGCRCQRPLRLHFGLGQTRSVDRIHVTWPGGQTSELLSPEINRYHSIPPPVKEH